MRKYAVYATVIAECLDGVQCEYEKSNARASARKDKQDERYEIDEPYESDGRYGSNDR